MSTGGILQVGFKRTEEYANYKHNRIKMYRNISKHSRSKSGFTIIEVLIVLALAALIMLIVFLAVPALQRNWRNHQRRQDASVIFAAISDCMVANQNRTDACNEASEVSLDTSSLSMYTGFHYGVPVPGGPNVPPTMDEPSYQFGVKCNSDNTRAIPSNIPKQFVVSHLLEDNSQFGIAGHCTNS